MPRKQFDQKKYSTKKMVKVLLTTDDPNLDLRKCRYDDMLYVRTGDGTQFTDWTSDLYQPSSASEAVLNLRASAGSVAQVASDVAPDPKAAGLVHKGGSSSGQLTVSLTDANGNPIPFTQAQGDNVTVSDS